MRSVIFLLCLVSLLGLTVGESIYLEAGQYHAIILPLHGNLSYHVGSLVRTDWISAIVAPNYCQWYSTGCIYYPDLSSPIPRENTPKIDTFDLPPTLYRVTDSTQLFLFITNENSRFGSTIVYDVTVLPWERPISHNQTWGEFMVEIYELTIYQMVNLTPLGIFFIVLLIGMVGGGLYGVYVFLRGCWQTRCMTQSVPDDQQPFLYSRIEEERPIEDNALVMNDLGSVAIVGGETFSGS